MQYVSETYCFFVILPCLLGRKGFRKICGNILPDLTAKTMEKNKKESKTSTHRSHFVMKVFLFVFCVAVVVLLAVVAKCLASLNDLNSRINTLEEEKILNLKFLRRENHDQETRRSKRGIDEAEFNKVMIKLEKLEGR